MEQKGQSKNNFESFDCDQFTDFAAEAMGFNIKAEYRQGVIDNLEIAKLMAIKVFAAPSDSNCSDIAPTFSPKVGNY